MPRIRMTLSLDSAAYEQWTKIAESEGILPATLAARVIASEIRRRSGSRGTPDSFTILTEWLTPRIDAVRDSGVWAPGVMMDFFEAIEREAPELYEAAEGELGRAVLNPNLGRFIRTRLGAEVAHRNGRPQIARVPARRCRLIQTVTLLKPSIGEPNA